MASSPGTGGSVGRFEAVDGTGMFERQADIVKAVQQTMALEGIDLEIDASAIRAADFLIFQIDRQNRIGTTRRIVQQFFEIFRADNDGQNAVFETVILEDIVKSGGDDAADTEIQKRPRCVLTR